MRITQVLNAQAVRFVTIDTSKVYLPDVVRQIRERYGFVGAPKSVDEILAPLDPNENRPLTFVHGALVREGRTTIIDRLDCYRQLVVVETVTSGSTDAADLVLDDFLGINPVVLKQSLERRGYISGLEVELDVSLDAVAPPLAELGGAIGKLLTGYLDDEAPGAAFQVISVALSPDPSARVLPADFRVERRVKTPFASNLYFTQAPLRTADHIAILEQVEDSLRGAATAAALVR